MNTPRVLSNGTRQGRGPICLFAQYHRSGRLQQVTFHYLSALAGAGFDVRVAMSGIAAIHPDDRAALDTIGVTARARCNAGLDFGAWRALIADGAAEGASSVLLANDSVFGPFAPLAPIMRRMAGFDAWGMVESREGRTHLQSWFVWMSGDAFRRPAVRRVFAQDFEVMSKPEIIVHGELGLSAAFEAEGLDVGARHQSSFRLRPSSVVATNPMHFDWRRLLADGTVPFLKAELLRSNPSRIIGVGDWEGLVDAPSRAMIRAALDGPVAGPARLGIRQTVLQLGLRRDRWAMLRSLVGHEKGRARRPGL